MATYTYQEETQKDATQYWELGNLKDMMNWNSGKQVTAFSNEKQKDEAADLYSYNQLFSYDSHVPWRVFETEMTVK